MKITYSQIFINNYYIVVENRRLFMFKRMFGGFFLSIVIVLLTVAAGFCAHYFLLANGYGCIVEDITEALANLFGIIISSII